MTTTKKKIEKRDNDSERKMRVSFEQENTEGIRVNGERETEEKTKKQNETQKENVYVIIIHKNTNIHTS